MEKTSKIRWLYYAAIVLLCLILQNIVLLHFPIFGVRGFPIVALVVLIAIHTDARGGGIFGFLCGIVCDAMIVPGGGFFAIYFMLAGIAVGIVGRVYFRKTLFSSVFLTFAVLCIMEILYYIIFFAIPAKASPYALLAVGLPQVLNGTLFTVVFYPLFKFSQIGKSKNR